MYNLQDSGILTSKIASYHSPTDSEMKHLVLEPVPQPHVNDIGNHMEVILSSTERQTCSHGFPVL